jgi:single-stranded-DNA-specific exonuclease
MIGGFMSQAKAKRWRIAPEIPPSVRGRLADLDPVLAQVLYNRGYTDGGGARRFLAGELPDTDSFSMADMNEAVARIRQAIQDKEQIAVYGDFDTDGVTSTALMVQTLRALGGQVEPHIPDRVDDGYGLTTAALRALANDGVGLIITVDCGMRAVHEVLDGNSQGLDIIITDHHTVGPELPPALAVVNPKREDCPYEEDMLAGVGVAYHLADALIREAKAAGETVPISQDDLLDLVAIGTVADLAPLDRLENRALVIRGLEVLNSARRPGLYTLLEVAGVQPGHVKSTNIGYALGPRMNAAGRMESASLAYELLMTADMAEAWKMAHQLDDLNAWRQEETQSTLLKARDLAFQGLEGDIPLLFAADPSFMPGIVGLVAGRLAEEFYRPAIVVEVDPVEKGECRGSCRSIPEFDIVNALDRCADLLVRHGGHSQAAGFTVRKENLYLLRDELYELAQEALRGQDLRPAVDIDAAVPLERLTLDLARTLQQLEPFGHRNPQPLLMTSNLQVLDARRVGKDGFHLKLTLGEVSLRIDAIAFRLGDRIEDLPRRVDVAAHLEVNEWNGRQRVQLNVRDIRPAT